MLQYIHYTCILCKGWEQVTEIVFQEAVLRTSSLGIVVIIHVYIY